MTATLYEIMKQRIDDEYVKDLEALERVIRLRDLVASPPTRLPIRKTILKLAREAFVGKQFTIYDIASLLSQNNVPVKKSTLTTVVWELARTDFHVVKTGKGRTCSVYELAETSEKQS